MLPNATCIFLKIMHDKDVKPMDKEQLKKEIKRIQNLIDNRHSKFIHDELKQYLKILKRELKDKE